MLYDSDDEAPSVQRAYIAPPEPSVLTDEDSGDVWPLITSTPTNFEQKLRFTQMVW